MPLARLGAPTVRLVSIASLVVACVVASGARAALWDDATARTIGTTAGWSNKVELADINGDGLVDILFANGGDYNTPGDPELNSVFANQGPNLPFLDVTTDVLGTTPDLARVIKVRDVNGDGNPDIFVGTTYQTQSRLYLGDGAGHFVEVTDTNLPHENLSVGDAEFGDVDGDGDLDLVLLDWGRGDPLEVTGQPRLWLNDGHGVFTDDDLGKMPPLHVGMGWELEFVDYDNDMDLDLLIASKTSSGSFLLENVGHGRFNDVSVDKLPQFTNNYDFEIMDMNGDGFVDTVTINDGDNLTEHIFTSDGTRFVDATDALWPSAANPSADDNMAVMLDVDSDGDSDVLIGSLSGDDRLLENDGTGHLTLHSDVFAHDDTPGTLGIAVADLNGDHRLDVVMSQGEQAFEDKVFLATDNLAPDTAPPHIQNVDVASSIELGESLLVRARVHDGKTPNMPHDWQSVVVHVVEDGVGPALVRDVPLQWYGEHLWRAEILDAAHDFTVTVCATDAAGNHACGDSHAVVVHGAVVDVDAGPIDPGVADAGTATDAGPERLDGGPVIAPPPASCACSGTQERPSAACALVGLACLFLRNRRRHRT